MMRYLPHTADEIAAMLEVIGKGSLAQLFSTVPEDCRHQRDISLPEPINEWELNDLMSDLSSTMGVSPEYKVFIGAGSYEHFIPESVSLLLTRSEFVTSYNPISLR